MRYALILLVALTAPAFGQQPSLIFDGCVDSAGQPVRAVVDASQRQFVRIADEGGRPVLLYNPDALPRRRDSTRSFLFAQACARVNLGMPSHGIGVADARRADCWGVETLRRSQLIVDPAGVAAVQADLDLDEDEWSRLPGPVRTFDLVSCRGEAIRLPSAARPDGNRRAVNACLHACGDRLFRCQKGALSEAGACMSTFDACEAACGR
ncbi:MAG: hypothetical protein H6945_12935 [Zoogloeaceae bacterium]|nr:hypothetical protein [Rhodocyclaceae bacterium]MCP5236630.1 hypothetical protein [Zoogloeaceae bacterium]